MIGHVVGSLISHDLLATLLRCGIDEPGGGGLTSVSLGANLTATFTGEETLLITVNDVSGARSGIRTIRDPDDPERRTKHIHKSHLPPLIPISLLLTPLFTRSTLPLAAQSLLHPPIPLPCCSRQARASSSPRGPGPRGAVRASTVSAAASWPQRICGMRRARRCRLWTVPRLCRGRGARSTAPPSRPSPSTIRSARLSWDLNPRWDPIPAVCDPKRCTLQPVQRGFEHAALHARCIVRLLRCTHAALYACCAARTLRTARWLRTRFERAARCAARCAARFCCAARCMHAALRAAPHACC